MLQLLTHIAAAATSCKPDSASFLGFPKWFKYIDGVSVTDKSSGSAITECVPRLTALNDIWLVAAAVIEILLRVAALGAIAVIIWGAIGYVTSQGEPDKTRSARSTILDGITGLVISIVAVAVVTFVAGRF